jgi:radical SAM superfamily enzyme YgiQ (UPF0313 family)
LRVLLISTYEIGRQPFGVASAAAWLRREGADVCCVDVSAGASLEDDQIALADLIAFHVPMHTATRMAIPMAQHVRRTSPGTHMCFFGLYAAMNEELLRSVGVETIVSGEFERGLVELFRSLAARRAVPPSSTTSLEKLRFVTPDRRGLPPLENYARLRLSESEERVVGYTEASRGCKHLCRHCPVVPVYEGAFRVVDRGTVLDDVAQQVAAGARHITFGDPDFWNGPRHARELVEELHRRHPDLTYDVTIKVEHLLKNAKDLPLLRDTGCVFVTSAIESVDDVVLRLLDKGHTRADFIRVAEMFLKTGLTLVPTFVTFTPWTSLETYLDLLQVLDDLELVENVAPIQLAIRLLIPAGSRLMRVESVRALVAPFDPAALCHPWSHPDPRMDALHAELLRRVPAAKSRSEFFDGARALSEEHLDRGPRPARQRRSLRTFVPYLTEPWYC